MRGSILDAFYYGSLVVGIVILAYVLMSVTTTTTTIGLQVANQMGADANSTIAIQQTSVAATNFATIVPLVLGIAGLGAVMAAAFLPVSPIFLPAGILMWLVAVIIFYNVQVAMPTIFNNDFFLPLTATLPLPAIVAENVGYLVLGFGAMIIVVMYGRFRGSTNTPEG